MRAALRFLTPVIAAAPAQICCNPDLSLTRSRPWAPVAADARPRRLPLFLRARAGGARLGRGREPVYRPHVLLRTDRTRSQPSARRGGGAPAGCRRRLLQRARPGVGRAGRAP